MKLWHRVVTLFSFMLFLCSLAFSQPAQALDFNSILQVNPRLVAVENSRRNVADDLLRTEFGQKIDVNNSDIRDFRELRGFYPKLASIIIQNAPYEQVEDVLLIPGLSDTQKERLQANLDNFTATPISEVFNEGDERYNAGVY
ncbi:photosystem II complex extrinsic protein PsbU [Geminocystis sp. GBBB08]|uniref:photosystem II complex extrinsic protein PsbU n=1 Tax=Geminocystis sp. GBBB08 TaxID=2604140 RepID=UPI0027E2DB23|nr:photosystem II complex extrinsic protein PsbU [Geminocystis sp. GBBB08]MBL1210465.1 photosystem II complex extrinsic protein PsbU [Geminocystis sp. GBBB08]